MTTRREKEKEAAKKWREANPEKVAAHAAYRAALRRGDLVREPCEECGSVVGVEGHHDDYDKPLEVRWLCPSHHSQLHGAERRAKAGNTKRDVMMVVRVDAAALLEFDKLCLSIGLTRSQMIRRHIREVNMIVAAGASLGRQAA